MKHFPRNQTGGHASLSLWLQLTGGLLVVGGVLSGCATQPPHHATRAAGRPAENIYAPAAALPPDVKRVAVLPIVADRRYSAMIEGCETLGPVLNAELLKTGKFETLCITPEDLRNCSGQTCWTGAEALPPELFSALREGYGCDAILFSELTEFHAYAPMTVGWRMKLVDVRTRQILWAGDEVFRAAPAAPNHANCLPLLAGTPQSFEKSRDAWVLRNSPRCFGEYTVARLLETLPAR